MLIIKIIGEYKTVHNNNTTNKEEVPCHAPQVFLIKRIFSVLLHEDHDIHPGFHFHEEAMTGRCRR